MMNSELKNMNKLKGKMKTDKTAVDGETKGGDDDDEDDDDDGGGRERSSKIIYNQRNRRRRRKKHRKNNGEVTFEEDINDNHGGIGSKKSFVLGRRVKIYKPSDEEDEIEEYDIKDRGARKKKYLRSVVNVTKSKGPDEFHGKYSRSIKHYLGHATVSDFDTEDEENYEGSAKGQFLKGVLRVNSSTDTIYEDRTNDKNILKRIWKTTVKNIYESQPFTILNEYFGGNVTETKDKNPGKDTTEKNADTFFTLLPGNELKKSTNRTSGKNSNRDDPNKRPSKYKTNTPGNRSNSVNFNNNFIVNQSITINSTPNIFHNLEEITFHETTDEEISPSIWQKAAEQLYVSNHEGMSDVKDNDFENCMTSSIENQKIYDNDREYDVYTNRIYYDNYVPSIFETQMYIKNNKNFKRIRTINDRAFKNKIDNGQIADDTSSNYSVNDPKLWRKAAKKLYDPLEKFNLMGLYNDQPINITLENLHGPSSTDINIKKNNTMEKIAKLYNNFKLDQEKKLFGSNDVNTFNDKTSHFKSLIEKFENCSKIDKIFPNDNLYTVVVTKNLKQNYNRSNLNNFRTETKSSVTNNNNNNNNNNNIISYKIKKKPWSDQKFSHNESRSQQQKQIKSIKKISNKKESINSNDDKNGETCKSDTAIKKIIINNKKENYKLIINNVNISGNVNSIPAGKNNEDIDSKQIKTIYRKPLNIDSYGDCNSDYSTESEQEFIFEDGNTIAQFYNYNDSNLNNYYHLSLTCNAALFDENAKEAKKPKEKKGKVRKKKGPKPYRPKKIPKRDPSVTDLLFPDKRKVKVFRQSGCCGQEQRRRVCRKCMYKILCPAPPKPKPKPKPCPPPKPVDSCSLPPEELGPVKSCPSWMKGQGKGKSGRHIHGKFTEDGPEGLKGSCFGLLPVKKEDYETGPCKLKSQSKGSVLSSVAASLDSAISDVTGRRPRCDICGRRACGCSRHRIECFPSDKAGKHFDCKIIRDAKLTERQRQIEQSRLSDNQKQQIDQTPSSSSLQKRRKRREWGRSSSADMKDGSKSKRTSSGTCCGKSKSKTKTQPQTSDGKYQDEPTKAKGKSSKEKVKRKGSKQGCCSKSSKNKKEERVQKTPIESGGDDGGCCSPSTKNKRDERIQKIPIEFGGDEGYKATLLRKIPSGVRADGTQGTSEMTLGIIGPDGHMCSPDFKCSNQTCPKLGKPSDQHPAAPKDIAVQYNVTEGADPNKKQQPKENLKKNDQKAYMFPCCCCDPNCSFKDSLKRIFCISLPKSTSTQNTKNQNFVQENLITCSVLLKKSGDKLTPVIGPARGCLSKHSEPKKTNSKILTQKSSPRRVAPRQSKIQSTNTPSKTQSILQSNTPPCTSSKTSNDSVVNLVIGLQAKDSKILRKTSGKISSKSSKNITSKSSAKMSKKPSSKSHPNEQLLCDV